MIRSSDRPWNSDSGSSDTMSISEDAEQLLIASLEEEVATLKNIIRLLLERDKNKDAYIKQLKDLLLSQCGSQCFNNVLEFL